MTFERKGYVYELSAGAELMWQSIQKALDDICNIFIFPECLSCKTERETLK